MNKNSREIVMQGLMTDKISIICSLPCDEGGAAYCTCAIAAWGDTPPNQTSIPNRIHKHKLKKHGLNMSSLGG